MGLDETFLNPGSQYSKWSICFFFNERNLSEPSRNPFRYAESELAAQTRVELNWTFWGGGPNRWRGGSSLWGHPFLTPFLLPFLAVNKNRDEFKWAMEKTQCSLLNDEQNEQEGEGWAPASSWFCCREATYFLGKGRRFFWSEHGRSTCFFSTYPNKKTNSQRKWGHMFSIGNLGGGTYYTIYIFWSIANKKGSR